nr:MAG TPA: hypothetical protein [Caudoviricetes sp.]
MFGFLHLYSIILIYFLKDNLIKSHPFLLSQNVNVVWIPTLI